MFDLEERNSLLSLLGLLNISEYFVTVDHSLLWQRHIAWSKPKGEDLRQYVTQRYASNMVFLSCMLAAEINVFFNSSQERTEMRALLFKEAHGVLRYWIGYEETTAITIISSSPIGLIYDTHFHIALLSLRVCILSNVCVTIVALFTTFTLWGMVSSIR